MNEVEDTRLKEFRQLKKEIRGSKDHLIVGIDAAKEKHDAFFGTAFESPKSMGKKMK
jgi:hypothetical protein